MTDGLVELRAIPLRGSLKRPTRVWTKSPKEIEAFTRSYGFKGSEYGVYFGVCKRSREGGKKEDVLGATCLWADIDCVVNGQNIDTLLRLIGEMPVNIQPSIVVHSGGGLHLYWLLEKPLSFEGHATQEYTDYQGDIEAGNRAVMQLVGGDNVADVTRVLRLPGSYNNKRRPEKQCHVVYCAHHMKYDPVVLSRDIERWGKVIDGDKWVSAKSVKAKTPKSQDVEDEASLHKYANALNGKAGQILDRFWRDRVRAHAPRGYVGIHEAIVVTTARLHCTNEYTPDKIVEKTVEWIKQVPDLDTSDWDWDAERKKIRHALDTWGPKWKQLKKEARKNG